MTVSVVSEKTLQPLAFDVIILPSITPLIGFIMSDLVIRKAHPIIEASYKLSLAEQRVILLSLAKLDNRDIKQREVTLSIKDYIQQFGADEKSAYRDLQNAAARLYERSIILKNDYETRKFRWLESCTKYHKGEGRISFEFSQRVMPYLFELDKKLGFTQYQLLSVSGFSSIHSIRIYELCKKIQGMQNQTVSLEDLKRMLQLEDKYPLFKEFNKFVIKVAVKEINEKSDLNISVEYIKTVRTVTAIKFAVSNKVASDNANLKANKKSIQTRLIHGVFEETQRPQVAKDSQLEYNWARANLIAVKKELRERQIYMGIDLDNNLTIIPDEWLLVIKKFATICDKMLSKAVSDELFKREQIKNNKNKQ